MNAENSSSGAYGIPQSLPGSKMATRRRRLARPTRPPRSSGGWATSTTATARRAAPGASSRATAGTDAADRSPQARATTQAIARTARFAGKIASGQPLVFAVTDWQLGRTYALPHSGGPGDAGGTMQGTRRFASSATVAATVAAVLGLAGPAHAVYEPEPRPLAWNPDGPVHATSRRATVWSTWAASSTARAASPRSTRPRAACCGWSRQQRRACAGAVSRRQPRCTPEGRFTTVDGVTHRGVVAINVADHSLISTWKGAAAGAVRDLVDPRQRRLRRREGHQRRRCRPAWDRRVGRRHRQARRGFDFSADNDVLGLALTGSRLILSGSFTHINGVPRTELASIDLSTTDAHRLEPGQAVLELRPVLGRPDRRHQRLRRDLGQRRRRVQPAHRRPTWHDHPGHGRLPGRLAAR